MGSYELTVVIWFTILGIVIVLLYFYHRDQKARKNNAEVKVKPSKEKRDSDKSYTIIIKEDGSVQVAFKDGEAGERLPRGRTGVSASYRGAGKEGEIATGKNKGTKVFADRNQMFRFLGGTITYDLPEIIPEEKGTYVLILYVWKSELTPIENPEITTALDKSKLCKPCGTQNDSDARYCKKCGKKLK